MSTGKESDRQTVSSLGRHKFPSAIPTELLGSILQALPQSDLFRICTLSSTFNKEVVRALYCGHVNLAKITFDQYISFTTQISRRPDLTHLIRELSLPLLLYAPHSYYDFTEVPYTQAAVTGQLSSALKSMNNLTSLSITRDCHRYGTIIACNFHSAIGELLPGCSFRLKTFGNASYWGLSAMLPFLREQNQIQDLELIDEYGANSAPRIPIADLLPNLSVLSISYDKEPGPLLFTVMLSRRLTRLKLQMYTYSTRSHVASAFQVLASAPASATLTHLYFCFSEPTIEFTWREADHIETLASIATALPHLKFLRYSSPIQLTMIPSPWDWESFPGAVSGFEQLNTLALNVLDGAHLNRRPRGNAHILAGRCMAACPTLRYFSVTGLAPREHALAVPQHISFIRAPEPGSEISVRGFRALEESAWRVM